MTLDEHKAVARSMSPQAIDDQVRALANDARFSAVVAVMLNLQEQATAALTNEQTAASHGLLAHGAGAVDAFRQFEGQLAHILNSGEGEA